MKLVKVILGSVFISLLIAVALSGINYTPMSERRPDTHYLSFFGHFLFSAIYLTPVITIAGLIAFLFYILFKKRTSLSKRSNILTASALSISLVVSAISLSIFIERKYNVTNDIYLVPEGYEGDVFVFYNVEGAPPVETEDGFEVHTINDEGYFVTSTPDLDYGTVTDQYFYVTEDGNRTPIDRLCVSGFGTGGTESEKYDLIYTGFKLTTTQCGEDFMIEGFAQDNDESSNAMIRKVLKQYYQLEAE